MQMQFLKVKEATGGKILSAADVAKAMEEEAKMDREAMWVLHLNTAGKIIEKELVSLGILNQSTVHPREIFKKAILNSANSIITVHNHPSGDTRPSNNDMRVWEQLKKADSIIGIQVIDNIIITPSGEYYAQSET